MFWRLNKEVNGMLKKIFFFIVLNFVVFGQGEKLDLTWEEKQEIRNYNLQELHRIDGENPKRLVNQVKSIAILSLGTMAVLYALPEDFTGWDRDDLKNIGSKYDKNILERKTVWDPDDAFFNFFGHPYVGAVYYIAARKSGYNEFKSFLFSFGMSTFFWEMGVEAFAEAPSIQDIVITPGAGAILGEYLYNLEGKIIRNDGKVGNSKFLGKTALLFIDPIGSLANAMGYKDDDVKGYWNFTKNYDDKLHLAYNFRVGF